MTTSNLAAREVRISELVTEYAGLGYEVMREPEPHHFPFDTFGYRPTLLARKGGEHVMVEVRTAGSRAPIDRLVELLEEVRRHGWRFRLVTLEDVEIGPLSEEEDAFPTWDQLRERTVRAERLFRQQEPEAGFLVLWASLEGMLRREAQETGLPIERLPSTGLISYLQTYGVLSHEQYGRAVEMLKVRNRVAHGFHATKLADAFPRLLGLAHELFREWAPGRKAA